MIRRLAAALASAIVALALLCPSAQAAEEILSFDADIEVQDNGDFIVTETIRVRSEVKAIQRGIYRDFPLVVIDVDGTEYGLTFTLISASRDGAKETTRLVREPDSVRIYLGRESVLIPPGVHTYEITYRTDRTLLFFEDHDEVFWNVTGTDWAFPILDASATVRFPEGVPIQDVVAFTGSSGSRERNATSTVSGDGNVAEFYTTQPLDQGQGLTVAVSIPKGFFVRPPSSGGEADGETQTFPDSNNGKIFALLMTLGVIAYYVFAWRRVGRDPPEGVMVPRWEAPEGVSPALTNYIWNRGLDGRGFKGLSAAIISLAVKGFLRLDYKDKSMRLLATDKVVESKSLPVGEQAILDSVAKNGGGITLTYNYRETVSELVVAFSRAMEKEHRKVYYRDNYGWIILGIVLSTFAIFLILGASPPGEQSYVTIGPLTTLGAAFTYVAVVGAKKSNAPLKGKISRAVWVFALFCFGLFTSVIFANSILSFTTNPIPATCAVSIILINLLFYLLMGAPTPLGRKRTDEINGLRHYIDIAEKDRMNMLDAPEMSVAHFQTLLPFAVALHLEKHWTSDFRNWLQTSTAVSGARIDGSILDWVDADLDDVFQLGRLLEGSVTKAVAVGTGKAFAGEVAKSGFSILFGAVGKGIGGGGGGGW